MDYTATSPVPAGTLIIGAGQAGLQLASTLRELGETAPITVVGGESRPPYQRPPLSKAFLSGEAAEQELALRGADYYASLGITLICGEWVEELQLHDAGAGAGKALTRSGQTLSFDRLALTVGGTPRRLRAPGADLEGIHYLRTLDDALALRESLNQASHVVVVGGGFVGLEIAAAATASGKNVTVLEAQDRLMARAVAPVMSQFYADAHRRRGARIELDAAVSGFRGTDRVSGVELADGRVIEADVVVVGIGLIVHTDLAASLGLTSELGIEVDAGGRTRIPGIVAAGDCAVNSHPLHGPLRLESVPNAIAQAKAAAASLMGRTPGVMPVPWFWSDQADLKLQMAGLTMGYDEVVIRGDMDSECFSALYYREGQVVSIESVNAPRDYMTTRRILESGGNIPVNAAGNLDIPLKTHLRR
ncbi:NAD(P)/FAD-dependent oxidoreductase [uncultured Citricoccus sp.]|uniref:NAD(P)/FAD-dependent oxidoreductase n=1 Tax=uncultured Citricoccus sp. TaxID=614031 RepID=UPI0026237029|nr:FAD-dependent oxidoreductase [uncultured Citricoccus sp.]